MSASDTEPARAFVTCYAGRQNDAYLRRFVPVGAGTNAYFYFATQSPTQSSFGLPPGYPGVTVRKESARQLLVSDQNPDVRRNLELNFLFVRALRPLSVVFADSAGYDAFPVTTIDNYYQGPRTGSEWLSRLVLTHRPATVDATMTQRTYEAFMLLCDGATGQVGMFDFTISTNWGRCSLPAPPGNLNIDP